MRNKIMLTLMMIMSMLSGVEAGTVENLERVSIGERIRDMIKVENGLILFLEDTASIALINLK